MVSFKVKFRPSVVDGREGKIYYQFIFGRTVKFLSTRYKVYPAEWCSLEQRIKLPPPGHPRYNYLYNLQRNIGYEIFKIKNYLNNFDNINAPFSIVDLAKKCMNENVDNSFFLFMYLIIEQQILLGRSRQKEIYTTTLNSLMKFCDGNDLQFEDFTADFVLSYEAYLKEHVTPNTSSFYMRNLRAVYNRAVEHELVVHNNPFKYVYTGIDKTIKRAVAIKVVKQLKNMSLDDKPKLSFARDMFLFSFYTRGMAFVDMAFLLKTDLSRGVLTYSRRKTGQRLVIKWEKCMQDIVSRYSNETSPYLLPIINNTFGNEYHRYRNASSVINARLKVISEMLGLSLPLTMYVARHTWASVAKSKNVPLSVISEGMGHDSESTTRIYLANLDTVAVDKANRKIINLL